MTLEVRSIRSHWVKARAVRRSGNPGTANAAFAAIQVVPPTDSSGSRTENEACESDVLRIGHLQIPRAARHEPRPQAERLDRGRLVGHHRGAAERAQQRPVAEHLRRLREPQPLARLGRRRCVRRRPRASACRRAASRGCRRCRPRRTASISRSDVLARETGPRRVVHQHPVVRIHHVRHRDQSVQHAVAPGRAAAPERRDAIAEGVPVVAWHSARRRARARRTRPRSPGGRAARAPACASIGSPARSRYCLGVSPPRRAPCPAAGIRPTQRAVMAPNHRPS